MADSLTHFVPFWRHNDAKTGTAEAICGTAWIPEEESTAMPTCPKCDAYFQIMERKFVEALDETRES